MAEIVYLSLWLHVVASFEVWCPGCIWQVEVRELGQNHDKKVSYIEDEYEALSAVNDLLSNWDWKLDENTEEVETEDLIS